MDSVVVTPINGEAYEAAVRGHRVVVDQPVTGGGEDRAPTPTELFVASLASCVAFYAGRYLSRHGVSRDGLSVRADFELAPDRPARVDRIQIRLTVPAALPLARRPGLLAVASHCTVHNTLHDPPLVDIELEPSAEWADAA